MAKNSRSTRSDATATADTPRPRNPRNPRKGRTAGSAKREKSPAAPRGRSVDSAGKHLVIVESPAKAKTINQYLGSDYVVMASVGHVRDLPSKAPKGSKQPVPGVDLENQFEPTYEVLPGKQKVVTDLKRAAKQAADIWFATDLDREGEAIAWHLTQELGIDPAVAKRVIFNAITKGEIKRAFEHPHTIDQYKVDAQQARRILDRIVGYQVSPLLWKKVARGLSAGRVQSVAVRLIVDREREIRAFVPDEYWNVNARFTLSVDQAAALGQAWHKFLKQVDEKGKGPTVKEQSGWMNEHAAIKCELVEIAGEKFPPMIRADEIIGPLNDLSANGIRSRQERAAKAFATPAAHDVSAEVAIATAACGLQQVKVHVTENTDGRGPARWERTITGTIAQSTSYKIASIQTKRTTSRPQAPFITSSLQVAASTFLGFSANSTMRLAQSLYEGVSVRGEGQVGLITYMRTDSTHLTPEAIGQARSHIERAYGKDYLPESANIYSSSNKDAQEAHEAIRPTDVSRTPERVGSALTDDQLKLYRLIWTRFVGGQMTPAQWDSTAVLLERSDQPTGAVFKAGGRVLVFDGFYRVAGVPVSADEQNLPQLREGQVVAPFSIEPEQKFTSPPPRYTEASLVKTLESEGIGRPSTYASIINVIQDRKYVEQVSRSFHATDLGEVVTDKLVEGFPELMDVGYTREMEGELDKIEDAHTDWRTMLKRFYGEFANALDHAHENMTHAKAEMQPAPYQCPKCGSRTCYRFGKNGRFLSCSAYPDCEYAAPIDREGHPMLPERVNVACPEDGSQMILRTGRFGEFLASINYPNIKYVINVDKKGRIKYPAPPPVLTDLKCPTCESPLNLRRGARGPWLGCSRFPKCRGRLAWAKVEEPVQKKLLAELEAHEAANPQQKIRTLDGRTIPNGAPIADYLVPGGVQELAIHPDAESEFKGRAKSA